MVYVLSIEIRILHPLIDSYRADAKSRRFPGRTRGRNFGENFSELEIRKGVLTYGRTQNPETDSNSKPKTPTNIRPDGPYCVPQSFVASLTIRPEGTHESRVHRS